MAKWNPFSKKSDAKTGDQAGSNADATDAETDSGSDSTGSGGIFGRFRTALKKTVNVLNTDIRDLVGKDGRLVDDEFLTELFALLIQNGHGRQTCWRDSRPDRIRFSWPEGSHG